MSNAKKKTINQPWIIQLRCLLFGSVNQKSIKRTAIQQRPTEFKWYRLSMSGNVPHPAFKQTSHCVTQKGCYLQPRLPSSRHHCCLEQSDRWERGTLWSPHRISLWAPAPTELTTPPGLFFLPIKTKNWSKEFKERLLFKSVSCILAEARGQVLQKHFMFEANCVWAQGHPHAIN